jgi:hypothetical protein
LFLRSGINNLLESGEDATIREIAATENIKKTRWAGRCG